MAGEERWQLTAAVYLLLSGHGGLRRPPAASLVHGRHHCCHSHALIIQGNMLVLTRSQHNDMSTNTGRADTTPKGTTHTVSTYS